MSDSKQSDHWDLLASVLGAEPQKKEPGEPVPQAVEKTPEVTEDIIKKDADPQASVAEPLSEPDSTPQAHPLSSWDALAMELGIEVKPEPPPPPASIQSSVPRQVEKKAAFPAEQPRELARPSAAEFGKNIEPFGTSETLSAEEPAEQSEKISRHRRRRHRKGKDKDRPGEKMKKHSLDSAAEAPVRDDITLCKVSIETSDKADIEAEDYPEEYSKEGETGKQHIKHRRSRRGSRKRKKKGSEPIREKMVDVKEAASAGHDEPVASTEISQSSGEEDEMVDEEHEDRGQRGAKSGFRVIPTWEEAVGFIVAKNMESRPRRQGKGPPHSRSAESHKRRRK
ncbi:MAG: hypothetical protein ABSA16_06585 [Thermoguttaceae bacterium]|jgi:hypothetical protein